MVDRRLHHVVRPFSGSAAEHQRLFHRGISRTQRGSSRRMPSPDVSRLVAHGGVHAAMADELAALRHAPCRPPWIFTLVAGQELLLRLIGARPELAVVVGSDVLHRADASVKRVAAAAAAEGVLLGWPSASVCRGRQTEPVIYGEKTKSRAYRSLRKRSAAGTGDGRRSEKSTHSCAGASPVNSRATKEAAHLVASRSGESSTTWPWPPSVPAMDLLNSRARSRLGLRGAAANSIKMNLLC
jgi:hypothetical protein